MKTPLLALVVATVFVAGGCDRRETPENQPEPQPAATADAAAASAAAPSGADTTAAETPPSDTGTMTPQAGAKPDDGVALGLLAAVNEHEIAAAKQAKEKNVSGAVLDYANMMEKDHAANLAKTRTLGTVGDTPAIQALKTQGEDELRTLGQGSGTDYSRAYMVAMVKGHQDALDLIDNEMMPAATSDTVKQHLTETRKAVETHLAKAREISATL